MFKLSNNEECKEHVLIKIGQIDFHVFKEMCTKCKNTFYHNMQTGMIIKT